VGRSIGFSLGLSEDKIKPAEVGRRVGNDESAEVGDFHFWSQYGWSRDVTELVASQHSMLSKWLSSPMMGSIIIKQFD
jgi:hypothetical protein